MAAVARKAFPHRMKDLCRMTGLSRQAIHFYIQQGLVPEGRKTGRNMAYYSDEHVERLQLIRKLQNERLLPLKTIKALLDNRADVESDQREMFLELKSRLSGDLAPPTGAGETEDARRLIERLGIEMDELLRMAELGYLTLIDAGGPNPRVPSESVWMLELWSQMRKVGFSRELGFSVDDLAIYDEAISALFKREMELLTGRLADQPPDRIIEMMTGALPLIHAFIAHYHTARVRDFFAVVD